MRSGGCAGSSRALRLDPFGLPVRFSAVDDAADGRIRDIELHRERVVVRRSLRGMRMALNMPVAAFAGIALRLIAGQGGALETLAVELEHEDPSLTLPLFLTSQTDEALAEWRAWSRALSLPMLLAEANEASRALCARIGLRAGRPRPRRRRRSPLKGRRPSILLRRANGQLTRPIRVHRGEREIIARN